MKLPKLAPCNLLSPHNAFGTKLVLRQAMNSHSSPRLELERNHHSPPLDGIFCNSL